MKDVYYFSHDANARRDPKIQALRDKYGPEGYGIYFMLIEIMSEQHSYKLEKFPLMVGGLARDIGIRPERMEEVLNYIISQCELLKQDDTHIWSDSLLRRKEIQEQKRQEKVDAGRMGGLRSGIARSKTKQNEAVLEATNQSKVKESKAKERGEYIPAPPSLEDIRGYCKQIQSHINPDKFYNYYTSIGWKKGGNIIEDWKAAIMEWESTEHDKGQAITQEKPKMFTAQLESLDRDCKIAELKNKWHDAHLKGNKCCYCGKQIKNFAICDCKQYSDEFSKYEQKILVEVK